jgi:FKBP-type peptidyl-prolyl cis-trans isomerase SlyD
MSGTRDTVAEGKVVVLHFELKDSDGILIDRSEDTPLAYLHGADNIVEGLERQLMGASVGDKIKAAVPPEEGYGLPHGSGEKAVPKEQFPEGLELIAGMQFFVDNPDDPDGESMPIWITKVEEKVAYIDMNHPLAGVTLHFDCEIIAIRDATAEEKEHGHPHGIEGNEGHAH